MLTAHTHFYIPFIHNPIEQLFIQENKEKLLPSKERNFICTFVSSNKSFSCFLFLRSFDGFRKGPYEKFKHVVMFTYVNDVNKHHSLFV